MNRHAMPLLVLLVLLFASIGQSQTLKWTYTNAVPSELTNGNYFIYPNPVYDGEGGSAWLLQGFSPTIPLPLRPPTPRDVAQDEPLPFCKLLWLNKDGKLLYSKDLSLESTNLSISLRALEPKELTMEFSSSAILLPFSDSSMTNFVRRISLKRSKGTEKDTALEAGSWVYSPARDSSRILGRGDFFTFTSRLHKAPEIVISRYVKDR